jgi:hypothetical protein
MNETDVKLPSPPMWSLTGGQPVDLVRLLHPHASPHVEHHRDVRLLRLGPHPVEGNMARPVARGTRRRDHEGGRAAVQGLRGEARGPLQIHQRDIADGQETTVNRAEVHHPPVLGSGEAVGELRVVALVDPRQEAKGAAGEDQLCRESEQVQGRGSILFQEGSGRIDALAKHDFIAVPAPEVDIALLRGQLLSDMIDLALGRPSQNLLGPFEDGRLQQVVEPPRRLVNVRIGVVDQAVPGVGHVSSPVVNGRSERRGGPDE